MTEQEIRNAKELINKELKVYEHRILEQTTIDIAYALRNCNDVTTNTTAFELIGYRRGFIDSLYWSGRILLSEQLDIARYYETMQLSRMEGNL